MKLAEHLGEATFLYPCSRLVPGLSLKCSPVASAIMLGDSLLFLVAISPFEKIAPPIFKFVF